MKTEVIRDEILYYEDFIEDPRTACADLLEEFFSQKPELILYGGPRLGNMAFQTDRPNSYTEMVGLERQAMQRRLWRPFTGLLAGQVSFMTEIVPTAAISNYYRDGNDSLDFHADYDRALGPTVDDVCVATVSFGVERPIAMRRIDGTDEFQKTLKPGSLFVMRGRTQRNWLHSIPKTKDTGARLSLTFIHHQLDPVEKRCWLLSEIHEEARELIEISTQTYDRDPVADILRNFTGRAPTPVLISNREAVFAAWCQKEKPENYIVIGGATNQSDSYLNPQDLLRAYPDLEEHIPKDSNVHFLKSRGTKGISRLADSLPKPEDVPLEDIPTDWLIKMLERGTAELQSRLDAETDA